MNIILLGAPFSGKGTLAKQIVADFGLTQISTGDLLRENINIGTEIGKLAKCYMDMGDLVPDDVVISMLLDRLNKDDCKNGVIFDGFPRTIEQAKSLDKIAKIDSVILLDVPFKILESRISGRRICKGCGEIYNTSTYKQTTCSKCGSPLYQRDDDKLETVRYRLEVYEKQSAPLIDFYADRLITVSGGGTPADTYKPVKKHLKNLEA